MNQTTRLFVETTREFCRWAEAEPGEPAQDARCALQLLARLYGQAVALREPDDFDPDLDGERPTQEEWQARYERFQVLPVGWYGTVFDPSVLPPEEAVIGDVADDLADIYRDLRDGLSLHDAGHRNEAVATWVWSFKHHWGRHASTAIDALHCWLAREE